MTTPTSASASRSVTVSAPGKVLLAGGYLVLEFPNVGLVVAANKRFYSTVKVLHSSQESTRQTVVVHSPQFHSKWTYAVGITPETFELVPTDEGGNDFVEKTLRVTLAYFWATGVVTSSSFATLDITIRADNDFYSVVPHLRDRNLQQNFASVASLPRFLSCPVSPDNEVIVNKTGLGSSAALVTSLVGSLLKAFSNELVLSTAHNLAQVCHCHAQGKVGSGFDVSSAISGSHVYQRFPEATLQDLLVELEGDIQKDTTLLPSLVNGSWEGGVVSPLILPDGLQLMLADVCGGSESPSMAKKVLQWKQTANDTCYWDELIKCNNEIVTLWNQVNDVNVDELKTQSYRDWNTNSTLYKLREAFLRARSNLKSMGEAARVPIEPDTQTALADATMELPGVVAALVPGAGGYDAMACLYVDSEHVRDSIAELWSSWKGDAQVCPLAVQGASYGDGLRFEADFGASE